jgi:hypothetical protein
VGDRITLGAAYVGGRVEKPDHGVNVVEVRHKAAQLPLGVFDPSRQFAALVDQSGYGVGAF